MANLSTCSACGNSSSGLKSCSRCKTTAYCNKDCQTAHWQQHKPACKAPRSDKKPFTAIDNGNFLHDRSEEEVYKILIDVVRMRQEDTYTLEGDTMEGTIYNQEASSMPAFKDFIRRAAGIPRLLPPWWTPQKLQECIAFSRRSDQWSLACAQEKSDIQEAWSDQTMPMKLRLIGEKVYGNTPGAGSGASILAMMKMQEKGDSGMHMSTFGLR